MIYNDITIYTNNMFSVRKKEVKITKYTNPIVILNFVQTHYTLSLNKWKQVVLYSFFRDCSFHLPWMEYKEKEILSSTQKSCICSFRREHSGIKSVQPELPYSENSLFEFVSAHNIIRSMSNFRLIFKFRTSKIVS